MNKKAILKQINDAEKLLKDAIDNNRTLTRDEIIDVHFLVGCTKYLVNKEIKDENKTAMENQKGK